MKMKLALLLACLSIISSTSIFACGTSSCYSYNPNCGGCASSYSCDTSCDTSLSYSSCSSCGNYYGCNGYPEDCDCVDTGYRYNDCISKSEYCEAFGNIGVR